MLAFRRLDIIIAEVGRAPDKPARVNVCWELVTQHSGLSETVFFVERSLSPQFENASEIETVVKDIPGIPGQLVYEYTDITANLISFWRKYFYRIRAEFNNETVFSEVRHWESNPRPHELAIIERHDFVLQFLQGAPSFAFIERTADAAKCRDCFDPSSGRPKRSDCTSCLGTGRQRPYLDPILLYVDYNPDQQLVSIANFGEIQPNEKDCWFSAYPLLKPGDIVYEILDMMLWRIARINTIQPQGTTIQHVARLIALERTEIEYQRLVQRISPELLLETVQEWERVKEERMF